MPTFPSTFPALLDQLVRPRGDRILLPRRTAQDHDPISFGRLARDADKLATALLVLGLHRGDHVGIVAENRYEWLLIDVALASIGVADVPRGSDTTPTELRFILEHSGSCAAFAENDEVARELLAMKASLQQLRYVVVMADRTEVEGALALGGLLRSGEQELEQQAAALRGARAAVTGDDLLTIVYTSGTTAEPKGVMLTHSNVLSNARTCIEVLHVTEADSFLSVLPAWHMYERIMDYLALAAGGQLTYTDRRRIKDDLKEVRPTIFAAVPRIWEMLHDGVVNAAMKLTGLKGWMFRRCLEVSRRVGAGDATPLQRLQHAVLDKIINNKVRAGLGGRLRLCASGGGALPRHVDETFLGMGIPLRNGYGLTETSPVAAVRLPHQTQPGHIGPPLPQTRVEARRDDGSACGVNETGVLWIQGPQVMRGYYQNPSRTREVLTEDGWFNSGDLGHADEHGNLWITGRAKDTIVLAGGENVEPEPLETLIKTSPLIEQVVVVGQDEKSLGALLVPSFEALERAVPSFEAWQRQGDTLASEEVRKLYRAELDRLVTRENGCRPTDRIASMQVLAYALTPENNLLTQTLKVRRHVVAERFEDVITGMFRRG